MKGEMKVIKIVIIFLFSILLLSEECSDKKLFRSVVIAPNPATDHFELIFTLSEDRDLNISIYDSNGNIVLEPAKGINYKAGENRIDIQTNMLMSGIYFCRLQSEIEVDTEKLMIVR
jgi:hypothetical protein